MPYKFSPSNLSLLKECPRCFWLHFRKKVKRPAGVFPSLPNGIDRVLKAHFDSFRDNGGLPPELDGVDNEITLFADMGLLGVWRNNFKGLLWTDSEGNVLRGAVDDILQHGKKLVVLDYKTRGFPLKENTAKHYQDQLDIYNFLLRKNGYATEDYAYLLFYHPDKVNGSGEVVFHKDLVKMKTNPQNAEKIIKKALEVLGGEMPGPKDGCGYCGWVRVCPGL